ncbi:MAG TPA: hypothetical protein VFH95_10865 [Candidatus Kapabacteria bacterium]|nr:hypothetical protein [Candidatus Kapabacteria bacterium]
MKRQIGAYSLALFALFSFLSLFLNSCSNPNSSPGTTITAADYSASAFFNTKSYGDTSVTPFPFCFPSQYLQQKLGLTDTQVTAIQNLQDSLRLALQTKLDSMRAAGTINLDSVRALRLEYQTDLYTGIAAILTPAQFAELQSLAPPNGPRNGFGRGPSFRDRGHRNDHDADDSARISLTPTQRDSLYLVRTESVLAVAGDTLTANQITLIQNLQTNLLADTTLTPQGRRAEFEAQIQTILTPEQLTALRKFSDADRRH